MQIGKHHIDFSRTPQGTFLNITKSTANRTLENKQSLNNIRDTYNYLGNLVDSSFNGDKFPGSFGLTKDYTWVDYYTLRARSNQLFKENPYARGLIRRLLTSVINTGLTLEAAPVESILGLSDEDAGKWADVSETDWELWTNDPLQCDYKNQDTLGELAIKAKQNAFIAGDCLVVLRINKKTNLPIVELIDGGRIKTPFMKNKAKNGNEIKHGVELNKKGVHTAFYVETLENGRIKSKRIPATGEKSGRKIAWLIYGTDKKLDDVRGEPLLSLVLYMLKEINRAMDSEQRAATINAMLPLFIKKGEKVVGSNPWNGGASARGDVEVTDHTTSTTSARKIIGGVPGQVFDELAHGEEPVSFNTQRPSASFGKFEEIILNTVAWSQELPPEILRLMFTNSFSASRQANNEFNIYLKKEFKKFGNNFYQPIYKERLISTVLLNQIEAKGLIEAWRDPKQWRIVGAWTNAIWMGLTRPSIDIKKDIDAMAKALEYGLVTGKFATNFLNGARYKDVMKQSDREKRLREKLDLHFKADEDNNGLPISEGGVITPEVQNNLMELLEEMKGRLEELEDKTEDMEV